MKPHEDFPISTIFKEVSCKETNTKNDSKEPVWKCRYAIALVGFSTLFYINYIRMNMSISIVAMVNNTAISQQVERKSDSCQIAVTNSTNETIRSKMEGEFNWTEKIQGYILGSYFFGYVVTQIPGGLLAERYGSKWFLFGSSLVTGVCTLLIPSFSHIKASAVIVLQLLRGFAQGIVQPALVVLVVNWFPKTERGFFNTFMYSGFASGCCLGSLFTGYISESAGSWPASLYVTGAGGILLALVIMFIAESPKVHPRISEPELHFILKNQEMDLLRKRPKLPWSKILKSAPVYALTYAVFGQVWALLQFLTVHSTFLATILHYSTGEIGLYIAISFLLQFLCTQFAAWISFYLQKKKITEIGFLRKFWNSTACLGFSACLFGMYWSRCSKLSSVIFGVLANGLAGIGYAGCWIVPADMAPTFAGSIQAICCTFGMIAGFLVPVLTGYIIDEMQTIEQWNKVFFMSIGVVMSSGIVFVLFGSAEIQPWNFIEEECTEKENGQAKYTETNTENTNKIEEQTRF